MIVDKLHKRGVVRVLKADTPSRECIVVRNAKENVMFTAWDLVKDLELKPDDELTVDIKILVERRDDMGKQF